MQLMKLAAAITLVLNSSSVLAQDHWDKFIEDSTFNIKARTSAIKLKPNRDKVNGTYTASEAAQIMVATKQIPNPLPANISVDALTGILAGDANALRDATQKINAAATDEVKKAGDISQGGVSLWGEFESGYLFDVIGYDFGYQGGRKTYNEGTGGMFVEPGDDRYHRISTSRVKLRFGDEEKNVSGFYGRGVIDRMHFGQDADDYLLNKTYDGAGISVKWDNFELYALNITGVGETKQSKVKKIKDFAHFKKAGFDSTHSIGAEFNSDFGSAKLANTWSTNYARTTSFLANSGVPLGWLGFDIADEEMLDYLLLFQFNYNWQSAGKDFVSKHGKAQPNIKTHNYEFTVGAQFDSLKVLGSFAKTGDHEFSDVGPGSGGRVAHLPGWLLINDFALPNQTTYTFVLNYNGKNIGLPGLELNAISSHSRDIDKDAVLAGGDINYFLTGKTEFTETLLEARYAIKEGTFKGLSFRGVLGREDNRAELSGLAGWIEYNREFF